MRFIFISLFALFSFAPSAGATPEFCHSTYCDPNEGAWYPRTPPRAPYGNDVKLSARGEWIDRSGHRVWANEGTERSTVISMNNSDQHNGELAYQTAYDSYLFGKKNGLNKVQHVKNGGRWTLKITTGDGIEIYKDLAGNAAVQTPDGRWHMTDSHGEYASSGVDLDPGSPSKAMVADKDAKKPAVEGRQLASVKMPAAPAEKAAPSDSEGMAEKSEPEAAPMAAATPAAAPMAPAGDAMAPAAAPMAPAGDAMAPAAAPMAPAGESMAPAAPPMANTAPAAPEMAPAAAQVPVNPSPAAAMAAATSVAAAPAAMPAVTPPEAPVTAGAPKPAAK